MKPRVLLVNLPYTIKHIDANRPKVRSFYAFPYGLLSVATYCRGLAEIRLSDYGNMERYEAVHAMKADLEDFNPEIVGFSMGYDNSYPCLEELAGMVKDYDPNTLVVLGGSAASYSYAEIIEEQGDVDAICFGEGEIPFRDLLESVNANATTFTHPSVITKRGIEGKQIPCPMFIHALDTVIDLDYSFVDPTAYEMKEAFSPFAGEKRKQFFLSTSRGCFAKCAFCSNATIHGKEVRQASVDAIIAHVERLVKEYGMEVLTIYDDQLLFNKKRAKELFRRLAPFNLRIEAPNGVSVAFIDEELAGLMRAAGMDTIYLAIESGSEYVLRELIHKPLRLSQVKPAVEALRKHDFFIHAFIVLGMPGETEEHRKETERFLLDIDIDWAGINLATPVRGSQLYEDCIKNGWIEKQKIGDIVDKKYVINYPGQDPAEVERQAYEINLNVNFHHNRRMRIGDYETAAACFRQVISRYEGHEIAKRYLEICERKILCEDY